MATLVLHPDPQSFPIGTTVKVRERAEPHVPYVGEPGGSILSEPVVAAGTGGGQSTLTVTVTAGKRYVGYASTGAVDRYVYFDEPEAASGGTGAVSSVNGKEGAVVLAAADVGADAEGAAALRLAKSANLEDVPNKTTARSNLELGTAATHPATDFDATGAATVAEGKSTPKVKDHAAVTTTGTTAAVNSVTPVDATSGALTIKLPTGQAEGALCSIIKSDASANEVTVEGAVDGGAAGEVAKLRLQNDGRTFVCRSDGTWKRLAAYLSVTQLDTRYLGINDASVTNTRTPTDGTVTAAKIAADAVVTAGIKDANVTKAKLAAAVQEELEPKLIEKAWTIENPSNKVYEGFEVKLGAHEAKNLVGASFKLVGGTSCLVKILKNGTLIASYEVTAESAAVKRVSSSKALANEDDITIEVSTISGSPTRLRVSIAIESVD